MPGVQVDEDRIEFDTDDFGHAVQVGGEQVTAAADADDRGLAYARKVVGQVHQVVAQEFDGLPRTVVMMHYRAGRTIDVQEGLLVSRSFGILGDGPQRSGGLGKRPGLHDPRVGIPLFKVTRGRSAPACP